MTAKRKTGTDHVRDASVIAKEILAYDMGRSDGKSEAAVSLNRSFEKFAQLLEEAANYELEIEKMKDAGAGALSLPPDFNLHKDAEAMHTALSKIAVRRSLSGDLNMAIHEKADWVVQCLLNENAFHREKCLNTDDNDGVEYFTIQIHNLEQGIKPLLRELKEELLKNKGPDTILLK